MLLDDVDDLGESGVLVQDGARSVFDGDKRRSRKIERDGISVVAEIDSDLCQVCRLELAICSAAFRWKRVSVDGDSYIIFVATATAVVA